MRDTKVLALAEAERVVQAIIEQASKDGGKPISAAVTDARGDLLSFARMDGLRWTGGEMALKKAETSARWGRDTRALWQLLQKTGHAGCSPLCSPDQTVIAGGVSIIEPGGAVSYGGIGVVGRTSDEDEALAFVGLKALQDFLWPQP